MTHAFQHDIKYIMSEKGGKEVKSSIGKLAEAYGKPFTDTVGEKPKPITPLEFNNEAQRKNMVSRCIDFQRTELQNFNLKKEIDKYLSEKERTLSPYALVAPYFYLTEGNNYKEWLNLMKQCVSDALALRKEGEKLFCAVVISKGILGDKSKIDEIYSYFSNYDLDGFLIWVDNFNEQDASIHELRNFIHLCSKLKNSTNEVINLHGGYFSVLAAGKLGDSVLSGVAHGPEFGEYRSVIPVGGGIPIAKYYIHKLHSRVRYRDAFDIFQKFNWLEDSQTFYKNVCSCKACKKVISNDIGNFTLFGIATTKTFMRGGKTIRLEYPTTETRKRCLKHYLNIKKIEYNKATTLSAHKLLHELEENQKLFEQAVGINVVSYLKKWREAF